MGSSRKCSTMGVFKAVFLLGMLLCVSGSDDIRNLEITGAAYECLNGVYVAAMGVEGQMPQFQNIAERVRGFARIVSPASWTNRPYYEKDGAAIFFSPLSGRWSLYSPLSERGLADYDCKSASALPPTEGWTERAYPDIHQVIPQKTRNSGLRVRAVAPQPARVRARRHLAAGQRLLRDSSSSRS